MAQVHREVCGAVCAGRSGRMGEVVPDSPPLCIPRSLRHLREGISAAETKRFAGSCYRVGGRGEADLDSEEGAWRCRMEERDAVRRAYLWESVEEDSNATIFNIFSRQDKQHGACDEYVEPVPWEESYDSASADSQHSDCEKEKKAGEGLASVRLHCRSRWPTRISRALCTTGRFRLAPSCVWTPTPSLRQLSRSLRTPPPVAEARGSAAGATP